ncbi:MAG TPA: hypothetical protein VHB54_04290 [Mucilaginibacter sp.]|nr:hypothetical protein [Mucilaginibacter sp.]
MEIAKLIVDFIGKIIWPVIVVFIIWKFRKPIAARLKDIKEIELPGGFKAKLDKLEQVIEAKIEESKEPIIDQASNIETLSALNANRKDDNILLAFTANRTQKDNLKYNIYYDPIARRHNLPFKYIGLYADKNIFAIGELKKIVACDYDNGKLVQTGDYDLNLLTKEEYDRIKGIIESTSSYDDIEHGIKFFLVDKFYETDYAKASDYPIRAKKYIWLDQVEGFSPTMTAAQIATLLNGKKWE